MPFRNSEYSNAEEALREREEQLRFVLEGSELGFWDWNLVTQTVKRNERWAVMLGYTYAEIEHTTQQWTDFIHPDDRERAWASIFAVLQGESAAHKVEYRMLKKQGGIVWILDQAKVMQRDQDGKPTRMCGTHTDITERKKLELELERQAHLDYLTGLNNRRYFMMLANQELNRSLHHAHTFSLLMLDVDHFKSINDLHGHLVGDAVLQHLVTICQEHLRSEDILGRIGGEEFAILLPETEMNEATDVAKRLCEIIAETPLRQDDNLIISSTVSIGVTESTATITDVDVYLKQADTALYNAKNEGRNTVCVWSGIL